ncbi:MAG: SOS response-associated peptidase [Deltaproteobacteria bacterium]|nr:SOS response-associated peptidase [Deltaproteobacteria bacterium]
MCGRFTLFEPDKMLAKSFDLGEIPRLAPRYNVAPGQPVAAVRASSSGGARELAFLRWGLIPSWAKDPSIGGRLINARAETVGEKPVFRNAFRRRRCIVPASGFYEWQRTERRKQPYYIRMRDGRMFGIAGLWDRWEGEDGSVAETCAVLTTAANAALAPVHDRMPVILDPGVYDRWLDIAAGAPGSLQPLLVLFPPDEMVAFPVGFGVNDPSVDDEGCIAPL